MEDNKTNKWDISKDDSTKTSKELNPNTAQKKEKRKAVAEIITKGLSENVVIFAGPSESGKTVALMRLTHFLKKNRDTTIEPNRTYRTDARYQTSVDNFLNDLHTPDFSPRRTANIDFLVLDVYKDAEEYCQFFEAPGEAFYDDKNPHSVEFQPYLTSIFNNENINKVFVFFFEEGMLAKEDPMAYSKRLSILVSMMNRKKDDVIVLFNKADKHRNLFSNNKPNTRQFKNKVFKDPNYSDFIGSLKRLGIPVKFVAFSSGTFTPIPDEIEKKRWNHSPDHFPETLWRTIDKCFKSYNWF